MNDERKKELIGRCSCWQLTMDNGQGDYYGPLTTDYSSIVNSSLTEGRMIC